MNNSLETYEDVVELTKKLISYKTVTPQDDGIMDFLQGILEASGFTCTQKSFGDDSYIVKNMYAQLGNKKPNICFAGHVDVVPTGPLSSWATPPFEATANAGKLYGRGTCDMKGAMAAFISAALSIAKQYKNSNMDGSISLLITGDEEGPRNQFGTKAMLEFMAQRNVEIDFVVVGEASCLKKFGDAIKIGRRGSVSYDITCTGRQGHVAYCDKADNPIYKLSQIVLKLGSMEVDKGDEHFPPSRCVVTSVDTGNAARNVIPEKITAKINFRYNTSQDPSKLKALVEEVCNSVTHQCEVHEIPNSSRAFLVPNNRYTNILSDIIKQKTDTQPKLDTSGGTSDARFIHNYYPVCEFGVLNNSAHQINENTDLKELVLLSDIYKEFLLKSFKSYGES